MQLWLAAVIAVATITGAIMCLRTKRLKNTGRGMMLFGIVMALYCVLTIVTMYG